MQMLTISMDKQIVLKKCSCVDLFLLILYFVGQLRILGT